MKALRRRGPGTMECVEVLEPAAGEGEVLVRVHHTGICGSDIHRFHDDDPRWDTVTLGHESAGVVAETGPGVDTRLVGARVAIAPLVPCHTCANCQRGWYSQCASYSFIGSRRDGAFAEYTAVPVRSLVAVPQSLDLERAALIEPLTVVLHPLLMAPRVMGSVTNAVVVGLGPIGLLAVQVLRWMGVPAIVACDVDTPRIELAREMGAHLGVNPAETPIHEMTDPLGGADLVIEASGTAAGQNGALRCAGSRGTVFLVGTSPKACTFEAGLMEHVSRKEITITGSWMNYSAPWPGTEWTLALQLLESGAVQHESLVTHRLPLERGSEGFALTAHRSEPFLKILVSPEEADT